MNVEQKWVMDGGLPHLVFFTSRRVKKGEEIITDYGDGYWKALTAAIRNIQRRYMHYQANEIAKMEAYLTQRHIKLPDKPPAAIETLERFQPKLLPYPRDIDCSSYHHRLTFKGDNKIEFLAKRQHEGRTQYLVKNLDNPNVYPYWCDRSHLSPSASSVRRAFDAWHSGEVAAGRPGCKADAFVIPSPPQPGPPNPPPRVLEIPDPESDDDEQETMKRPRRRGKKGKGKRKGKKATPQTRRNQSTHGRRNSVETESDPDSESDYTPSSGEESENESENESEDDESDLSVSEVD